MGAAVGTDDKKSVNVDVNIVPFIDLLSCLTAFLLVTAAWTKTEQLDMRPKGKTRDSNPVDADPNKQYLSVLIQKEQLWIGISRINDFRPIPKLPSGQDWDKFETTLADIKKNNAEFVEREDLELAAESTQGSEVPYNDIIQAMDLAIKVGFKDVGLSDPQGLSARPTL